MRFSTVFALFSIVAVTSASAITPRNANHVSMYTTDACNDKDKYYKYKSTQTCSCISVDLKALSLYTDMEPAQHAVAFSDSNCKHSIGTLTAKKCTGTDSLTTDGPISSVMFWLPGVCDVIEAVKDIVEEVEDLLKAAATKAAAEAAAGAVAA